jgi:branched-chain amino acid transport system substrate-binding protein
MRRRAGRGRNILRSASSRSALLLAFVALSALALAVPSATAAAQPTRTVTLGVIVPVDGGLTSFGMGIRDSARLAVQQANAREQLPGWHIRLRVLDDSSDPAKGAAAARTLAADKNVVAVIGPYNSGVAQMVMPVLAEHQIALVSSSNTLTSLTLGDDPTRPTRQWPDYFRLVGPDSVQAKFLAHQARTLGYSNAAVVSETKAVSKGLADAFARAFTAAGGTVSVQQVVPDGATEFDDFLTAAAAAPAAPDLLFFGGEYNVAAGLRVAASTKGLNAPLMGGDGMNDPAFINGAGAAAEGSYAGGVGVPLDPRTASTFRNAYKKAGFTSDPTDYGPYAYDATNSVIAVLRSTLKGEDELPTKIRPLVVAGLQSTDRIGITGRVAFDAFGDARKPRFSLDRVQGAPLAWAQIAPRRGDS